MAEGNVERLLLPIMISKAATSLRSSCTCILEVGGAFGHKFKSLIEFLGIVTLIITDVDSVTLLPADHYDDDDDDDELEIEVEPPKRKPLMTSRRCWAVMLRPHRLAKPPTLRPPVATVRNACRAWPGRSLPTRLS